MKIEDFNKDFVVTIEMQTDLRQKGVYGINTTDDFHGTYRNFHRLAQNWQITIFVLYAIQSTYQKAVTDFTL